MLKWEQSWGMRISFSALSLLTLYEAKTKKDEEEMKIRNISCPKYWIHREDRNNFILVIQHTTTTTLVRLKRVEWWSRKKWKKQSIIVQSIIKRRNRIGCNLRAWNLIEFYLCVQSGFSLGAAAKRWTLIESSLWNVKQAELCFGSPISKSAENQSNLRVNQQSSDRIGFSLPHTHLARLSSEFRWKVSHRLLLYLISQHE